jgi:hypothetical protein
LLEHYKIVDQNQSQSIADLKMGMKFVALEDVHTISPVAIIHKKI